MNNSTKQFTFLFFLAIVVASFSGCGKKEITEEKQEIENVEVVENIEKDIEEKKVEENNDNLEDINDELVTITTEEIDEEFELKAKMDTSDWLTYRNEEYGFEVKYPRDWVVEDYLGEGNSVLFFDSNNQKNRTLNKVWISYYDDCSKYFENTGFDKVYMFENLKKSLENHPLVDIIGSTKISGFDSYVSVEASQGVMLVIFIQKEEGMYTISFDGIDDVKNINDLKEEYKNILNSFKFTK